MSNGGLLEKAMDQQVDERKDRIDPITGAKVDEYHETITDGGASEALVAEIFETPTYDDKESILSSILGIDCTWRLGLVFSDFYSRGFSHHRAYRANMHSLV